VEQPEGESQTPNPGDPTDGPPTASQPTTPVPVAPPTATEQTPVVGPPPISSPPPAWSQPLPPPPPGFVPPPPGGAVPPPGPPDSPWSPGLSSGAVPPPTGVAPVWGVAGPPPVTAVAPKEKKAPGPWRWVVVAVVAALLGSVVGGSIVAASNHDGSTTVKQISAGPALLNGTTNIEKVIAGVLPAVVSIDATAPAPSQGVFGGGSPGTLEEQGTGMIITADGEVVTNNHVISGATVITVTLYGQTKAMPATLVDTDTANDVALLKINNASNLPTVSYGNSDNVQVGDAVVAIGNALGLSAGTPTVTQGIISAKGRTVQAGDSTSNAVETLTNMFQTDAAINPGNSGGPLVDSSGKVIGMNTAVAASSNGSSQAQNIGFAIPANKITGLLPALRNKSVNNQGGGFLGVGIETLTSQLRSAYGFIPTQGAIVTQVEAGSPASVAGIQQGDVITTFDGKAVTGADQLQQTIQGDHAGQSVKIGLYRGQQQLTVTATLASSNSAAASGGS
jgi:S1-C subfamily serine protease